MSSYTVSIYINDGDIHRHALTKEIPTEESAKNYATFRFEDGSFYPFKTIHSVKVFEFVGRTDGTEILHLGTPTLPDALLQRNRRLLRAVVV